MVANNSEIEKRLWSAADELRANSRLKASEYSVPVLGLIFLRYADQKFTQAQQALAGVSTGRRTIGKADYQARGVLYLPEAARFSTLLALPEGADIAGAINDEFVPRVEAREYSVARFSKKLVCSMAFSIWSIHGSGFLASLR
jgi:type I restriction enzyme M protein